MVHNTCITIYIVVPTGYPRNLHVAEITNTSAVVTWDPVEESKRNSEISGYIIQYNSSDQKYTNSKSINSPTSLQTEIRFVNLCNVEFFKATMEGKMMHVK